MFTPLITHDLDGAALAAPVNAARCNGAAYKTRTIDDLHIKDDRLRAAIEGTGHLLFDGGMGTMLQAAGLKLGARPEELNITDPQLIEGIHAQYAAAGSRIINANTFGASAHKLAGSVYSLEEIIAAGIANCKRACAPYGALAALDVGPLGELLEPNGTLAFEDAVEEYARIVRAGAAAGADLIFFETFTDLYELKAALLAARENSSLPILASMSFEAGGRTFTG